MATRVDSASRFIGAPPSRIYDAFASAEAMESWLPPAGMTGTMLHFDFRPGGGYRMRLSYVGQRQTPGKTSAQFDEVEARFVELVKDQRIEQSVTFDSNEAAFSGVMRITWLFDPVERGTNVTVRCEAVPEGIRPEDHEAGLKSTLDNLAAWLQHT